MISVKICVSDSVFVGVMHGSPASAEAEAVFTTSHAGYVESCTDPSYAMQALVFAHTVVGAHGISKFAHQSSRFWPAFVIATQPSAEFIKWVLSKDGCVIAVDDTRELIELSRHETMVKISDGDFTVAQRRDPDRVISAKNPNLLIIDFGCKVAVFQQLERRGISCSVKLPSELSANDVRNFRGAVLLSSGPGDPRSDLHGCSLAEAAASADRPVFGICYGHQLLALAHGLNITKMLLGHRGANHPVQHTTDRSVMITSHNHGYAVTDDHVAKQAIVSHRSLLDNTIEGLSTDRFSSVQFHPEGHPGPLVPTIIDSFVSEIRRHRVNQE